MGKFVVMVAVSLAAATAANASIVQRDFGNTRASMHWNTSSSSSSSSTSTTSPGAAATPEIDPAGLLSGMTLLLGGLAVVRGRRRKSS